MREKQFSPTQYLDKCLTRYRYSRVFSSLKHMNNIKTVYDLGCGSGDLVHTLFRQGYDAYGIDVAQKERIMSADLNLQLPLADNSVDLFTSLANIEHLREPQRNLDEVYRTLRKGGALILTTPSLVAKPILEFIAYKLKLIDPFEIEDHKMYFTKRLLGDYLRQAGFQNITIKRFQLGLNLHAVAIK